MVYTAVAFRRPVCFSLPALRELPLRASCGFPSPAADYAGDELRLEDYFLKRPNATFAVRMQGEALTGAGIFDGDTLFVDTSVTPANGHLVLAVLNGELIVRRLVLSNGLPRLHPENPAFAILEPTDSTGFSIEGVVVSCGRRFF